MAQAEIIAIGDELTCGHRLDTNSRWLAQRLTDLGCEVTFHTTVGDNLPAIESALTTAARRVDLIVCTGGLGPTADDLTRQAVAAAAGTTLQLDPDSLAHIRELFRSRGRDMPASNETQAYVPRGGHVIHNQHGSAPGIDIVLRADDHHTRLFALPGVPAELHRMWQETVHPAIQAAFPREQVIRQFSLHCFGAGESEIESRLPDIVRRGRSPAVGITASRGTISLRITASAASDEECWSLIRPTEQLIRDQLGSLVFGDNDITLQEVVVDLLKQLGRSLAIVDSGVGGLVQHQLAAVDRGHQFVKGGWVVGPQQDLATVVNQANDFFGSDLILAIGAAREEGERPEREIILHGLGEPVAQWFDCACHPDLVNIRSAKQALNFLRLTMATYER